MDSKNSALWGWLIPGLGLLAVGLVISMRSGHWVGLVLAVGGLGLCICGVAQRDRAARQHVDN